MKKIFIYLFFLISCFSLLIACRDVSNIINPPGPGSDNSIWTFILAVPLALYEIIIRVVPTVQNWSFLHLIVRLLKWISDRLNNQKNS